MSKLKTASNIESAGKQRNVDFVELCGRIKEQGWGAVQNTPVSVRGEDVVSRFKDNRWDWSQYALSKAKLSKSGRVAGYISFSSIKNENMRNEIKLAAYGWMFFVSGRYGKESEVANIGSRCETSLGIVAKFLKSEGRNSLGALSDANLWRRFTQYIKERQLSYSTCIQITSTLRALSVLNPHLPFHYSDVEKKPAEWSRKVCVAGSDKAQTLAIPTRIAETVYGEAVRLVEDAYEHVDAIEKACQWEWDAYCDGAEKVRAMIESGDVKKPSRVKNFAPLAWRHAPVSRAEIIKKALHGTGWVEKNRPDGKWFTRHINRLQTAAFICIAGFTGMRDSEMFGVRNDSFVSTDIGGLPVDLVQSVHEKLTKGGKVEEWVACPVVGKAIRVAAALVKHMQQQWKDEEVRLRRDGNYHEAKIAELVSGLLWLKQGTRNALPNYKTSSTINDGLKAFVKSLGDDGIITQSDYDEVLKNNPNSLEKIQRDIVIGQSWPLAKHQMRRTFAVFVVKNKLGHAIALKQQFKHIHLKMTEWYSNGAIQARVRDIKQDSALSNLVNEVLVEQTAHIIVDASKAEASGGFGKAIQAEATVYGSWDAVYGLIKQGRLSLSGAAHGYCKNGYQCDMDGAVNPAFCVPCENSLISDEKLAWWEKKHDLLVGHLKRVNASRHELSHFLTQIRAAESVMQSAGREFVKYQVGIEVIPT